MSDVIDVQTAVIGQLLDLLAAVPAFGDAVREDWVAGVLDAEDSDEPERLIICRKGTPWNVTGRRAVSWRSGP
ncbi:hypothetical protein ACET4C_05115 [Pseudomonas aeruginosa]|uniref:hypothetical protein n=1 Tax=Pseudomonas aeruginosa TaxID=287 RepID=UPI0036F07980